jgi:uncharacterized protein
MSDVAGVVAGFGGALREAGLAVGADRCERFARAIGLVRPQTAEELLLCAVTTLASSREQGEMVARVFEATFGRGGMAGRGSGQPDGGGRVDGRDGVEEGRSGSRMDMLAKLARAAREHHGGRDGLGAGDGWDAADGRGARDASRGADSRDVRTEGQPGLRRVASAAERLAGVDFAEMTPAELLELAGVMRGLTLAVPVRRSHRQRRGAHGRQADLRATLRHARRSGAYPFGIIKKIPARRPRKLVVLCDISGSMEPYARAMLQLLYCAAGGARAEVFSFATRLTRLTKTLMEPEPGLALQRAGQAAPDWLGGTRIGVSLKEFNDSFGIRGLARGAVVVVVSDGWDTGDPVVVRREMERLSRVAFRIVWVNPRSQSPGYLPLAGGMAAAWPYCDAVVSAHRLDALGELTAALADPVRRRTRSGATTLPV